MALTLTQAEAHLDQWVAADLAVAAGKSFNIGDRSLRYEDSSVIRDNIDYWNSKVAALKAQASAGTDDYAYNQPGVRVARWTR